MAVIIKSLNTGTLTTNDNDRIYPPAAPGTRAAIIKSIRLVNKTGGSVKVKLWVKKGSSTAVLVSPVDMVIPAGLAVIDDSEITLDAGDELQGKSDTGSAVDFCLSGVERDV